MKVALVLLLLLGPPFLLMKGCASLSAPPPYRYKMTVYVASGGKLRAFSSVRQVTFYSGIGVPDFSPQHRREEHGEAIPIELPGRPTYFALLGNAGDMAPESLAIWAARAAKGDGKLAQRDLGPLIKFKGVYDLPRDATWELITKSASDREKPIKSWPTIISFWDIDDPTSVRLVEPDTVGIKRVTIEITNDPVDRRIEQYFPKDFATRWAEWQRPFDASLPPYERKRRYGVHWHNLYAK